MDSYEQNYINGQWVDSIGGTPHQVINPATEEPGTKIVLGTKADVDAAVAAAKAAFKSFSQTSREERVALLERIIEEYKKRMPDIAASLAVEMGAPISLGNAAQAPAGLGGFMGTLEALKNFEFSEKVGPNIILYEPIGVVGMITPWNWPLNQITLKVAPALAGGNTMVLKPSEECPGSAAILAEVMDAAGVPRFLRIPMSIWSVSPARHVPVSWWQKRLPIRSSACIRNLAENRPIWSCPVPSWRKSCRRPLPG